MTQHGWWLFCWLPPMYNVFMPEELEKGLTPQEAQWRLKEHGPNALPEAPPPSDLVIFISQFKNPLVYVLVVAGVVTFFLKELADTAIIFLAVFVNTILGFLQERKASKALEALKKLLHPHAKVIRGGELLTIGVEEIVPGDVVVLHQGDKVPADGELFDVHRFYVSEAILTGESVPVEKEDKNEAFMGTVVTAGTAKMLVKSTGVHTEMGKIAVSVSELGEDTPLRRQLAKFSKSLSILVLGLILAVFVVGLLLGKNPVEIFTMSVALAVSAIPEGLLVGLTVVLAIGMQRILAKKGLVRNLVSAETLGGVTTICVDKTGTLTEGKMQVVNVVGDEIQLATQVAIANDLDDPVVIAAWEWGTTKVGDVDTFPKKHQRFDSMPFSSEKQYFASLNRWSVEHNMVFVNGAPEVILARAALPEGEKKILLERIESLSGEGKRLLGFARKKVSISKETLEDADVDEDLEWMGLLAFSDPIREDVKEALKKTQNAGIRLIVITGDYAKTALSVLEQLDLSISEEAVILGDALKEMTDEELAQRISGLKSTVLFARTKPDQKLKIVDTLKKLGEVVAMTGDGVNDAPALSKADIGVVVSEASDVAKESADLVLLDSSFATIVEAIEEGRGIFDNIRKILLYLMSDAFEEILVVLATLVLGLPLPITAAQVLWVNLISDGFPNLALTVDPKASGIMNKPPRSPKEPLVASWVVDIIVLVSLIGGIFAFGLFFYSWKLTGHVEFAQSVTFATVGVNSLVYVFSIRALQNPFWHGGFSRNRWLVGSVLMGLVLQVLPFVLPGFRAFFDLRPLGWFWVPVFGASILMFISIEILKWVFKARLRHSNAH